jgi:hypothetical protein
MLVVTNSQRQAAFILLVYRTYSAREGKVDSEVVYGG